MTTDVQNLKKGNNVLGTVENSPSAQNLKTGADALGTVANESGNSKHENGTR
jgi:hypothetical protein